MDRRGVRLGPSELNYYRSLSAVLLNDVRQGSAWSSLAGAINEINDKYSVAMGDTLLSDRNPEIVAKPYESILSKTYRKNISQNDRYPEPPDGGWRLPENWYSRINDVIRTTIANKYLDRVIVFAK